MEGGGGDRWHWPSWKSLRRRLKRFNITGFCGSSKWVLETNAGEEPLMIPGDHSPAATETVCIARVPAGGDGTAMNLATALAADRRRVNVGPTDGMKVKPLKSVVRLFEEIEGGDAKVVVEDDEGGGRGGIGTLCCLCTERNKGAALIPCGHTYCRMCSRAMWSKQGTCPLCNRSITEVLEIF